MHKTTLAVTILAAAILGSSAGCSAERNMTLETARCIYYVPIGAETYVAVTQANIRSYYVRYRDCEPAIEGFPELKKIILNAPQGTFDPLMVRAMVKISPAQWVFVDNYGGVRAFGKNGKLTMASLAELKAILDRVTVKRLRKLSPPRQHK